MATRVMITWTLILLVFWSGVFTFFSRYYDGAAFERRRVAVLEKKFHKSARALARIEMNFSEYKDALVLAGVKIKDNTRWTDSKRMIASVLADPDFKVVPRPQPGQNVFQKGRKLYLVEDYKRASEIFEDFLQDYPDHPSLPEAAYLLSECYFQLDQVEPTIKIIDFIVTHFPETEFAGYGLLRLAQIFEKQERPEDAVEVYDVVIKNFSNSNAAYMAKGRKKDLDL